MGVRPCHRTDIGRAIALARIFHEESPAHRDYDFDAVKVMRLIEHAIDDPMMLAIVAEGSDGDLHGFAMFFVSPMFFGNELELADVVFYTRPTRRGSVYAARMIEWAADFGVHHNVARYVFSVFNGIDDARAARFFSGCGFEKAGEIFAR